MAEVKTFDQVALLNLAKEIVNSKNPHSNLSDFVKDLETTYRSLVLCL